MYQDRQEAGRKLAAALLQHRVPGLLVLAMPRGGVEVGYEVARALDAELDVLIVRKLGAPYNPEYGFGAIASHGARYVDERAVRMLGLGEAAIEQIEQAERRELERREMSYRGDRPPLRVEGRTVILVDDGIATGSTARAAVAALRGLRPAKIILGVPVGPPEGVEALRGEVDELVCPMTPAGFHAVGQWYEYFDQTSDRQVTDLLERRREELLAASKHGAKAGET